MSIFNPDVSPKDLKQLTPARDKDCTSPKLTYTKVNGLIIPGNDECENKDHTAFEGSSKFNVVAMYFASHFFKNTCVITGKPYEPNYDIRLPKSLCKGESCVQLPNHLSDIPREQTGVSLRWIEKDQRISVPEPEHKFWENFLNCEANQRIALPFGFNCKNFGHANWIIVTNNPPTVERFESFSNEDDDDDRCIWNPEIDVQIEKLFKENFKKYVPLLANFEYIKPFMKKNNIQTLQEEEDRWKNRDGKNPVGFCSVWSLWYIHFRTSNPDKKPSVALMKNAIDGIKQIEAERKRKGYHDVSPDDGDGYLTDFIRRYSLLLVSTEKHIRSQYRSDDGFQPPFSSSTDGGLFRGFKGKNTGAIYLKKKSSKKKKRSIVSLLKNLSSSSKKSASKKSPLSSVFSPIISPINPNLMPLYRHLNRSKKNKKSPKKSPAKSLPKSPPQPPGKSISTSPFPPGPPPQFIQVEDSPCEVGEEKKYRGHTYLCTIVGDFPIGHERIMPRFWDDVSKLKIDMKTKKSELYPGYLFYYKKQPSESFKYTLQKMKVIRNPDYSEENIRRRVNRAVEFEKKFRSNTSGDSLDHMIRKLKYDEMKKKIRAFPLPAAGLRAALPIEDDEEETDWTPL